MQCFNSLQKYDLNGLIYSGVVYDRPTIKIDSRGSQGIKKCISDKKIENDNEKRSVRRSRTTVKDYVKTNPELKYFVTYTLDPGKINRYDEEEIYRKIRNWLSDRVKLKGLKYILVPEKHKDGAWHFHGFVNKPLEWKYGFCRMVEMDREKEMGKIINYTVSYIKKDMEKFNGRRYLHSQNLWKPGKIYSNVDFDNESGKLVELKELGVKMKIQEE